MPARPCRPTFDARATDRTEEAVYETYRMLGREHELDLEREAHKLQLGASLRRPKARPLAFVVRLITALFR